MRAMTERRRALIANKAESPLPSGYILLKRLFVLSTNGKYIDTNSTITQNTKSTLKFRVEAGGTSNAFHFFGAYLAGYTFQYYYGSLRAGGYSQSNVTSCSLGVDHIIAMQGTLLEFDSENYTLGTQLFPSVAKVLLFGSQYSGNSSINTAKYISIYNLIMEDNGVEVRNLVPALRIHDNKPGFYDLCGSVSPISNTPFYVNAGGTGEFGYETLSGTVVNPV